MYGQRATVCVSVTRLGLLAPLTRGSVARVPSASRVSGRMAARHPLSQPVQLEARIVSSSPEDETAGTGPRHQWIDVTFAGAPVSLSYISFHNYYCAHKIII